MEEKTNVGVDGILETPESAFKTIDEDSNRAGGAWAPPEGYEGSIGSTMFDTPSSKDGTITILMAPQNIDELPSQALVRIESRVDGRTYLGAVVEGPFAEPDGLPSRFHSNGRYYGERRFTHAYVPRKSTD